MAAIKRMLGGAAGRIIAALLLVALILFAADRCQSARQAGETNRLGAKQAAAVSDSAADAINAVGAVSGRSTASDTISRDNADAIRNAAGADAPVHPDVRVAGLRSLCRRAAYRGKPECVQFAPPE